MIDEFNVTKIALWRRKACRKPISHILLVRIPAYVLGALTTVVLFPIYMLWMVYAATCFAIHHIVSPRELFRNMRNAEF